MQEILTGDVFKYIIAEKLSSTDLFHLSETFKDHQDRMSNLIKSKTIKELEKILANEFGDLYQDFENLLGTTGSVISGSIIIQAMLNEYWENTDIDIFVPMIGNNISYTEHRNPMTEIDDFMFSVFKFVDYIAVGRYSDDIDNHIRFIRNFERKYGEQERNKKYRIQIIIIDVSREDLPKFILENFDLDICKNILSFSVNSDLQKYSASHVKKLYTHALSEIVTKKTTFKIGNRIGSTVERCKRYEKRGFTFANKNVPITLLRDLLSSEISTKCFLMKRNACSEKCVIMYCRPEVKHDHYFLRNNKYGYDEDVIYIDPIYLDI